MAWNQSLTKGLAMEPVPQLTSRRPTILWHLLFLPPSFIWDSGSISGSSLLTTLLLQHVVIYPPPHSWQQCGHFLRDFPQPDKFWELSWEHDCVTHQRNSKTLLTFSHFPGMLPASVDIYFCRGEKDWRHSLSWLHISSGTELLFPRSGLDDEEKDILAKNRMAIVTYKLRWVLPDLTLTCLVQWLTPTVVSLMPLRSNLDMNMGISLSVYAEFARARKYWLKACCQVAQML